MNFCGLFIELSFAMSYGCRKTVCCVSMLNGPQLLCFNTVLAYRIVSVIVERQSRVREVANSNRDMVITMTLPQI